MGKHVHPMVTLEKKVYNNLNIYAQWKICKYIFFLRCGTAVLLFEKKGKRLLSWTQQKRRMHRQILCYKKKNNNSNRRLCYYLHFESVANPYIWNAVHILKMMWNVKYVDRININICEKKRTSMPYYVQYRGLSYLHNVVNLLSYYFKLFLNYLIMFLKKLLIFFCFALKKIILYVMWEKIVKMQLL